MVDRENIIVKRIKQRARCCVCNGSLVDNENVNVVELDLIARWRVPVVGNASVPGLLERAVAVLCDCCIVLILNGDELKIEYAVEWTRDVGLVKYHSVGGLDPLPANVAKEYKGFEGFGDLAVQYPVRNRRVVAEILRCCKVGKERAARREIKC